MDMKLTTGLAIITALTHHYLSLAVADNTIRGLNASPVGFSLRLVANPETSSDHTVRRSGDGFLHLHHRLGAPVSNVTIVLPETAPQLYANVGTGSGQRHVLLKYDATGSLTWLQCDPCTPKARQLGPMFAPHLSPTYHNVEGTSATCTTLFEPDPATGQCTFRMVKTGISVKGLIARDHFSTISGDVIPDYLFGCVHDTRVFRNGGRYAGVFVNSRAPYSFASQGAARGVMRYSYCLSGEANHHGFLRFGTDVPHNEGFRTTRILPALGAHDAAYHVSLVGVSLGAQRLDRIRMEMFHRRKDGQGGCIVDIGTPLTVMAQEAYRIIEEAVWADLERYHGVKRTMRVDYGLCVQATEAIKGHLPSVSLHFAGEEATLVVPPEQLFLMMEDEQAGRIACLAMAPGPRTVIGALQQVGTRFVFDLKDDKLYFAPESCTRDAA